MNVFKTSKHPAHGSAPQNLLQSASSAFSFVVLNFSKKRATARSAIRVLIPIIRGKNSVALLVVLLLLLACPVGAQVIRVQTEGAVTLSVAQEAEHAIDRAQTWLKQQPLEADDATLAVLRRYAVTPGYTTLELTAEELELLNRAVPVFEAEELQKVVFTPDAPPQDYKALFALQRFLTDMPPKDVATDWRETMAQCLINAQRVTSQGAYWKDADATLWGLLTLRALLYDAPAIKVIEKAD